MYMELVFVFFFFFKQKTAYEMSIGDWSSDVCSSDLLKEKVERFKHDAEIQALLKELGGRGGPAGERVTFSAESARTLKGRTFDLAAIRGQGYAYERLDQLTMELLLGAR